MKKIFRILEKIKSTDSGILILGESGTGKSALARAIHYRSPRRNRPFREIHCAQIPFGLLESELFGHERGAFTGATQRKVGLCEMADGGTLFLDDINVVPNEIQAKLLRFIENKTFVRLGGTQDLAADARIVAASNEDLEALCREGRFREDLYFRLKVILIDLPPLRERPEDTIAIALDYLKRSCGEKGIPLKTLSPETIQLFQKAPWRGNVRELQNVLERVVILCDDTIIVPEALPEDFLRDAMGMSKQSHRRLDELVEEIIKLGGYSETSPLLPMLEALIVKKMVGYASGKGQAAQLLGISKPTLYARLRDYEKMR
jgi:DNA-binding NtrC family response regulator